MAKKSRKQRAQLRKHAQGATAERLDVAPPSGTVASLSPPQLIRHASGMRLRIEPPPVAVEPPPVAIEPPPVAVEPPPVAIEPPPRVAAEPAPDHRVSPRVSLAVDIHLASHSHFFSGLSGDISEGGVFLSTYRSLPIGSSVDLEFSLPGSDQPLHVRGVVKWVRDHSAFGPRGVGIAFEELAPDDRHRIHEFCTVRPALYYDLD